LKICDVEATLAPLTVH